MLCPARWDSVSVYNRDREEQRSGSYIQRRRRQQQQECIEPNGKYSNSCPLFSSKVHLSVADGHTATTPQPAAEPSIAPQNSLLHYSTRSLQLSSQARVDHTDGHHVHHTAGCSVTPGALGCLAILCIAYNRVPRVRQA